MPPSSLVTTTYDEVAEEVGDLAQSEEDVLMYALFPNEARTFLSKHRASERVDFLMQEESSNTKEDDYVDINQIRELVRVAEESGVGEIVVEEERSRASPCACRVQLLQPLRPLLRLLPLPLLPHLQLLRRHLLLPSPSVLPTGMP